MDPVQQLSFAVALSHNDFHAELGGLAFDQRDEIVMGGVTVNLGFAAAEPAEVGSVDDIDGDLVPASAHAAASRAGSGTSNRPGLARPSSTTNRSTPERVFLSPAMDSKSCGRASAS